MKKKAEKREESVGKIDNPEIRERAKKIGAMLKKSKLKAAVLVTIEKIYSHMPKAD